MSVVWMCTTPQICEHTFDINLYLLGPQCSNFAVDTQEMFFKHEVAETFLGRGKNLCAPEGLLK